MIFLESERVTAGLCRDWKSQKGESQKGKGESQKGTFYFSFCLGLPLGRSGDSRPSKAAVFLSANEYRRKAGWLSITQSGLTGGNVVYSYGYDDHGRVSSFTSPAGTRNYSYNSFDQLTGATGGTQTAEVYQFDKNGNQTGSGVVIGQYNRVTKVAITLRVMLCDSLSSQAAIPHSTKWCWCWMIWSPGWLDRPAIRRKCHRQLLRHSHVGESLRDSQMHRPESPPGGEVCGLNVCSGVSARRRNRESRRDSPTCLPMKVPALATRCCGICRTSSTPCETGEVRLDDGWQSGDGS